MQMPTLQETRNFLDTPKLKTLFAELYGQDGKMIRHHAGRYQRLIDQFQKTLGDSDIHLFSTPGRIEIGGNHTDHNHGRVLAASINLDAIAAVAKKADGTIRLYSEGFPNPFTVDLKQLPRNPKET